MPEQQLTSTAANGCTNGCTNFPENAHGNTLGDGAPVVNTDDAQRLALLADDADLRAVVDGWEALPDAVRAGVVAMLRAAT